MSQTPTSTTERSRPIPHGRPHRAATTGRAATMRPSRKLASRAGSRQPATLPTVRRSGAVDVGPSEHQHGRAGTRDDRGDTRRRASVVDQRDRLRHRRRAVRLVQPVLRRRQQQVGPLRQRRDEQRRAPGVGARRRDAGRRSGSSPRATSVDSGVGGTNTDRDHVGCDVEPDGCGAVRRSDQAIVKPPSRQAATLSG